MLRLTLMLAVALVSCSAVDAPPPITWSGVLPIFASDHLQGRWTISSVNGRPSSGLWLELGGAGFAKITTTKAAVFVRSPQPPTRAYLGCNDWFPSGWTSNGNKLTLGLEMSHRTERGYDYAREALDSEAYATLSKTMTIEFTSSSRLRLTNDKGVLELFRNGS